MSAGEILARKPAKSRDTAVVTMRNALVEFRRQATDWQRDVESLFDEFEATAVQTLFETTSTNERRHAQSAEQLQALVARQDSLMELVSAMSERVAQISTANAPTGDVPLNSSMHQLEAITSQQAALAAQQTALAEEQKLSVSELSQMRQMVERQTEMLTSFSERPQQGDSSSAAAEAWRTQSAEQLSQLAAHQMALAEEQKSSLTELNNVRQLVERQMELLNGFSNVSEQIRALPAKDGLQAESVEQLGSLATQQKALAEELKSSVSELGNMRKMVERQTELLTAFSGLSEQLRALPTKDEWKTQSVEQLGSLAAQQKALAEEQKSSASELANMRKMVERQTELLAAFSGLSEQIHSLSEKSGWQTQSAEQLGNLVAQQKALAEEQKSSASELSNMRRTVERQTELLAAISDLSAQVRSMSEKSGWQEKTAEQLTTLAAQQKALTDELKSSSSELSHMRRMVEKQSESLAAFSDLSEQVRELSTKDDTQSAEQIVGIVTQQKALAKQQQASVAELQKVRSLVEKQMELMAEYSDVSQRLNALSTTESWQANSEEQLDALTSQQETLADQQKSSLAELANVKRMMEKQMELLATFSGDSERLRAQGGNEGWQAKSAEQLTALSAQQEALAGQQKQNAAELANVRRVVEQQMELLMAFFEVSERLGGSTGSDPKSPKVALKRDPVVDAVKAQFEKLQPH